MNEFLFSLFIISGFLLGTVLFNNILYYSMYLLPRYITLKISGNLKSPTPVFVKITYPVFLWLVAMILALFSIRYFFIPYFKMFISGIIIALVFILIDLLKKK